jgi:hypothetical protein
MNRFQNALASVLFSLALVACNASGPAPSHVVPMLNGEFGAFSLLIYDSTGLVLGAQRTDQDHMAPPALDPVVTASPERNAVDLAWLGGACTHQPTLVITGEATHLVLQFDPEIAEGGLIVQCPAIGLGFAVRLSLAAPVEQGSITLELR